ncbi:hypothetical protein QR680_009808 [Steinernema hermaphroditum]|uniref:Uncharacterized protein n=1 Tax=Steinernema hermaphroditum TaxID=289476 RepID=A0AA39M9J8_9BILA|nr:hypothetical protein QR680_009808 [Steinernema hermaphroditum]
MKAKKTGAGAKKKEQQPRRHFLESEEEDNAMDFLDEGGVDSDDDDAPVEVSSKRPDIELVDDEAPEPSLFEMVEAEKERKKADDVEKKKVRNAKKRLRREAKKRIEKLDEGVFKVDTGRATFNIVSLAKSAVPTRATFTNFRENTIQERTRAARQRVAVNIEHKKKWSR